MGTLSNVGLLATFTAMHFRHRAKKREQALDMARLCARESELNGMLNFMQRSAEEEKSQMARGLHDELGGVLTSAKIDVSWLRKAISGEEPELAARLERLSRALDEAVNIERRVVETLRPSLLDHLGLGAALDWYVSDTCRAARIACTSKVFDDASEISAELAIAIYRVVEDALGHIVSCAQADEIEISLKRGAEGLHLVLSDNHDGTPGEPPWRIHPQRLALIRQRALGLGGSFELDQPRGRGTRLRAFFPAAATPHRTPDNC